jgi:hypothetical protein
VVEHSIGNGEVDSSILSGSTSLPDEIKYFASSRFIAIACNWHLHAERGMKWRAF